MRINYIWADMQMPFKMFGLTYLLTLAVFTISIVFALNKLQTFDHYRLKKYFHPLLALLVFSQVVLWRVVFIFQNDFSIARIVKLLMEAGRKPFEEFYANR